MQAPREKDRSDAVFVPGPVLKRDIFSEISTGRFADRPDAAVTYRRVVHSALWVRPLAWYLARREIRALRRLAGHEGTPELLKTDRTGLYRSWIDGAPLHVAKPYRNEAYFREAKHLLRELRRRGVAHNDLAKPQNWLITPDGRPALIDMQLAQTFAKPNALLRLMAREDLRHLLKHKRTFCRDALTPSETRLLARKSLPSRIWMRTFKPVYNRVTRGLFHWSDGEGTQDRFDTQGKAILERLAADPDVADAALSVFPFPRRRGVGLYAFVEPRPGADAAAIERRVMREGAARPDIVQCVPALPRDADGRVREDLLRLVAINQTDQMEMLTAGHAGLAQLIATIAAGRRNLSDRRLRS